ncbi:MAG TPA: TROVE domain-containing protein, partial [Bacteroidia bacterium]|nr:TROVE domain-containing protein [Bacteroidia bacterium]
PIPNSLKKGLSLALNKFNAYQLAKYKGEGKEIALVDLFNLIHPKPLEAQAEAYKDLMEGKLASTETWEAKLSAVGKLTDDAAQKAGLKAVAWYELVTSGKIGYFALLRNLRNILEAGDPETIDAACKMLVNEKLIKNSLVLPFRYMTAQRELKQLHDVDHVRKVMNAVNDAVTIALNNVPVFEGRTLVALDRSGSMGDAEGVKSPAAIGSLFASVIAKTNDADIILFDDSAEYLNINLADSVVGICENIRRKMTYGGTNFNLVFDHAKKKYDRIIILSDMQAWIGFRTPQDAYARYCKRLEANPKIYTFDLQGYGTMQFPQEHVYSLAGFSEKTLDIMKSLETDPTALITKINEISFSHASEVLEED